MKRLLLSLAALLSLAVLLVACSGSGSNAGSGGGSTAAPSADADALQLSAKDVKFSTNTLQAPAGKPFQIVFDNQEGAPHNVAIYKDEGFSQKVFGEDPFPGPKQVTYQVPAQTAGTLYFRCDVHPDMKGTLEVK